MIGRKRLSHDLVMVLGLALALRLLFAAIVANTYDPDEFVYLSLAKAMAHGAVPYHSFAFFHPPGMLFFLQLLNPLTSLWWPLARLADILIDAGTACLVWAIGLHLYGRRGAAAAGILYAASPVALVTSVRVMQEPIITFLAMAGLLLILTKRAPWAAVAAGFLLALSFWIKYPALLFAPAYVLAAGRRAWLWAGSALVTAIFLFAPYLGDIHTFFAQTVLWQLTRPAESLAFRLEEVAVFLVLVNPLSVLALRQRPQKFLVAGFAVGLVYLFAGRGYYHYFMPMMPFAALLGAPLAARLVHLSSRVVLIACVAFVAACGGDILAGGPGRSLISAPSLSADLPVVHLLDHSTEPDDPVLADRFEYAYLAGRTPYDFYFWDMTHQVHARRLEDDLDANLIVDTHQVGHTFPRGFYSYLDRHYHHHRVGDTTVWFTDREREG
ncbi:MAG: ArnT family glycosyltransferase [Chloroflexota bacterium]